ncbi:MAG: hypothetical protein R2756_08220 [Bacteroidales bacterium]
MLLFQTGNLLGASMGLETLFSPAPPSTAGLAAGAAAAAVGAAAPANSSTFFSSEYSPSVSGWPSTPS